MPSAPPLTNLQRELLDLFALDLPEDELREIKHLLARYFAEKATAGFDAFADSLPRSSGEQELSPEDTDRWATEHARASTPSGEGNDKARDRTT
jgi:hypothetical protein